MVACEKQIKKRRRSYYVHTTKTIGEILAFIEAMAALGFEVELTKDGNFKGTRKAKRCVTRY